MESVTRTTWKTGDGQEFFSENQALAHEAELNRREARELALKALKAKFKIKDIGGALSAVHGHGNISEEWAFLADAEDEQEFRDYFHLNPDHTVAPGWNLITVDYNDNGPDYVYCEGRCDIERQLAAALAEVRGI